MTNLPRIGIDTVGGDFGPEEILKGCAEALKVRRFIPHFYGVEHELAPIIATHRLDSYALTHVSDGIAGDVRPSMLAEEADTSLHMALRALKAGEIDVLFSPGHTGAIMALAIRLLGVLPGAKRPALGAMLPSPHSPLLLLDVGANADCKASYFPAFAILGRAYYKALLGEENPTVALLSNGEEDTKGNKLTRAAHNLLREYQDVLCYRGHMESNFLLAGRAHVALCDGFVGNVLLKALEGIVETLDPLLRKHLAGTSAAQAIDFLDHREYGGAPLLGVQGDCIVAHGRSTAHSIKNGLLFSVRYRELSIGRQLKEALVAPHYQAVVNAENVSPEAGGSHVRRQTP